MWPAPVCFCLGRRAEKILTSLFRVTGLESPQVPFDAEWTRQLCSLACAPVVPEHLQRSMWLGFYLYTSPCWKHVQSSEAFSCSGS